VPLASDTGEGLTAIDTSAAAVTVSVVLPLTPPDEAAMFAVPVARVEARPRLPEVILTVAIVGSDELQFADCVIS
jgi:hypothetical protein